MAGDALSFGDASVRVLWPGPDPPSDRTSQNDDSLVMRIGAGGMNFLLPGDVGSNAEKGILASGEPLQSQVLKVGHRRSKSSTSRQFLARIAPRVAIITLEGVGRGGDVPNPETLSVLENAGARIFRSDIDGATTVEWKDRALTVRTYRGTETVVLRGEGWAMVPH
jgi:competence protein ComEC